MNNTAYERKLLSKPGDTILEILEHHKMSQVELAERMGKTPSKVNDIISGKEPITISTALILEKVLGIDANFWLNRELIYREKLTRIEQEEFLDQCKDWLKIQPIKELKANGYILSEKPTAEMADEFLKFYGVATPKQWESIYLSEYVNSNFRKSEKPNTSLGALAAWLRIGEIGMKKLNLPEYNKENFKRALIEIKKIVKVQPEDFAVKLQEVCISAGVAIVYTICIPKAPVSGVARWIGGNPLIQLTDRYKSNDQFWVTFFHEAAHILLHGKKDIFIDDINNEINYSQKEEEANKFAYSQLLPEGVNLIKGERIIENDIKQVARTNKTHPAIVLNYLQRNGFVEYSFGNSLKEKVSLEDVLLKNTNK